MSKKEILEKIADKYLHIESLDIKNNDSEDFHEVAVWDIAEALEKAYAIGVEIGHNLAACPK